MFLLMVLFAIVLVVAVEVVWNPPPPLTDEEKHRMGRSTGGMYGQFGRDAYSRSWWKRGPS